MSDLPIRDIARALVFEPAGRLLLIAYEAVRDVDPSRPGIRRFWFLPGGGLETGETHDDALKRELGEEIGRTAVDIVCWAARCEGPFGLFRKPRFARERYAVVRLPDDRIDLSRLAESEDNPVLGVRWWALSELRETSDIVEPVGIADLASRIQGGTLPPEPVILAFSRAASQGA